MSDEHSSYGIPWNKLQLTNLDTLGFTVEECEPLTGLNVENVVNSEAVTPLMLMANDSTTLFSTIHNTASHENHLKPVALNMFLQPTESASSSACETFGDSQWNSPISEEQEELLNLLKGLRLRERKHRSTNLDTKSLQISFLKLSVYKQYAKFLQEEQQDQTDFDQESKFISKFIYPEKSSNGDLFHCKLKHFFIFSHAGKPIYSLNGSDDVIVGYMGLLTTVISSFDSEVHSLKFGNDMQMCILNKEPLIFVAILKLSTEFKSNLIAIQLNVLYDYLLSILSLTTINKSFANRMNYDLRKVLNPLDYYNLDSLALKLTYGLAPEKDLVQLDNGLNFFISVLLDRSIECAILRNTTRQRLNSILLSCKRVKQRGDSSKSHNSDTSSILSYFSNNEREHLRFLGSDLLFAYIIDGKGRLLSKLRTNPHCLGSKDLLLLFSTINSTLAYNSSNTGEDYWMPLCMPHFNSNGFLYVFIKSIDLADFVKVDGNYVERTPLSIVLVSGNKNSFFEMQKLSNYIIHMIAKKESFRNSLANELNFSYDKPSSTKDSVSSPLLPPCPVLLDHFIFRLKDLEQFAMVQHQGDPNVLKYAFFYTQLCTNESTIVNKVNKKLTIIKWQEGLSDAVVGFRLCDDKHEFYALYSQFQENESPLDITNDSSKLIKWCEKYSKRLWVGEGAVH
ncbi:Vacuolar fusion protein mon1 [Scheffersomyces spartinae]|uniref:Vacuolar fusion protein MON1 n=1 Tax=Scheffersomyces spartinae TaxID=45513 RepID=A0A9P8AJF4_9ASCO|nr:Vacuolar fusion protein mon1 [Scheffersomyces spartinae]KAG7194819.1 Vacuolar fusion protein mon1 [Scheffersomyces spartinae]